MANNPLLPRAGAPRFSRVEFQREDDMVFVPSADGTHRFKARVEPVATNSESQSAVDREEVVAVARLFQHSSQLFEVLLGARADLLAMASDSTGLSAALGRIDRAICAAQGVCYHCGSTGSCRTVLEHGECFPL